MKAFKNSSLILAILTMFDLGKSSLINALLSVPGLALTDCGMDACRCGACSDV